MLLDVNKEIKNVGNIFKKYKNHYEELTKDFKNVNQSIRDLEHIIELDSDVSASNGYKIYKDLRTFFRKRRELLNQRNEVATFLGGFGFGHANKVNNKINKIEKSFNKLKNNMYSEVYNILALQEEYGETLTKNHNEIILEKE